jgi:2-desacetyl-2-hydroxyethyl bacteriochlorophyllide A dehydrogenase
MAKMKAVMVEAVGKMVINEVDIPTPKAGEALLKIKYCGICGSDLAVFTGNQPFASYPRIPGHEFSAEVVKIEKNYKGIKPGMIVTCNPYFNDGKCYSCQRGKVNCCENNQTMGVQRDGAYMQYITMPIERIYDGKGLDAKILAMIEPFSIGYHAANRAQIKENEKVLVIGAGPIGLFAMISAILKGAEVYITDLLDERLQLAMKLGAKGVINGKTSKLDEKVKEITKGNGFDTVMEAVGQPATVLDAINSVCFGGKIVLIGNGKKEITFNHSVLVKKELDIFGSRNSLRDFEPLIDIVKSGKANIEPIMTNIYPMEKVMDAFNDYKNNDGKMSKVLIQFD